MMTRKRSREKEGEGGDDPQTKKIGGMGDDAEGGSAATATATSKPEKQKGGETKEGGGKGEGKKKDGKSKRGETNEGGEAKEGEGEEGKKKGATSDAPVEVTATYAEGKAMLNTSLSDKDRHKGIWVSIVDGGHTSAMQGVKVGDSIVRIDGKLLPPLVTKTDGWRTHDCVMAIVGKQRPVTVDFRRGAHLTMEEYEASPEESRWTLKDLETAAAAYKEAVPKEEPKGDDDGPTAKAGENEGGATGDKNNDINGDDALLGDSIPDLTDKGDVTLPSLPKAASKDTGGKSEQQFVQSALGGPDIKFHSSKDIAKAVFPDPIVGTPVPGALEMDYNPKAAPLGKAGIDQRVAVLEGTGSMPTGEVTLKQSLLSCYENTIIPTLRKYYFSDPVTSAGATENLSAHKRFEKERGNDIVVGHSAFELKEGKSNLIYCGTCLKNELRDGGLNLRVIARVCCNGRRIEGLPDGTVAMAVEVTDIYPHCHECTTDEEYRRNYRMDPENGGPGWIKVPFAQSEVFGTVYDEIVESLKGFRYGAENVPGEEIENHTMPGMEPYYYDTRRFEKLHGSECDEARKASRAMLGIDEEFVANHDRNMIRLKLVVANAFNSPREFFDVPASFKPKGSPNRVLIHVNTSAGRPGEQSPIHHAGFADEACLFDGHEGPVTAATDHKCVDQVPHHDQVDIDEGEDKAVISVSNNPKLRGLFKCGSIVTNLDKDSSRVLYFKKVGGCDTMEVAVRYGEFLYFTGDTVHGGKTYPSDEEPYLMRPSLHINVCSSHHSVPLDKQQLDESLIAMEKQNFLPLLTKDRQATCQQL